MIDLAGRECIGMDDSNGHCLDKDDRNDSSLCTLSAFICSLKNKSLPPMRYRDSQFINLLHVGFCF